MTHLKFIVIITIVCLISSCVGSRSANNSYEFEEVSKLTQTTRVNKILIVGSGGIGTHFFMDNISEELTRKFKDVNVETGYEFLGYKKDFTSQLNKLISAGGFDAVLQFKPLNDAEKNPIVIDKLESLSPAYRIQKMSVRFTQDFTITLFAKNTSAHSLWEASLNTNFDSRQNKFYTRMANDILIHLQEIYK
jgi:hypothetical protein